MWNWEFAAEALPILLRGFVNTLTATVVGTAIAVVLGLILAVAIRGLPRWINWLVRLIVAFIRNTPLVVQLLFVYYAFADIPGLVDVPALVIGFIVMLSPNILSSILSPSGIGCCSAFTSTWYLASLLFW